MLFVASGVLLALKLAGLTDVSWWIVFAPILVWFVFVTFFAWIKAATE